MAMIAHGGRLDAAMARHGGTARDWLDLSTGINPVSYPVPSIDTDTWSRLPDDGALARCLEAARAAYGPCTGSDIVAGPGTQALIQWLPRLVAPGRALIVAPTYAEYAQSAALAGHAVATVDDLPAAGDLDGVSLVFVCRPNNPDGRVSDGAALLALADGLASRGGLLVVDEAFCDVTPAFSLCPHAQDGMLILRSFGKFFGLAGLRLGFAIGATRHVETLKQMLGPWAVSGPALQVGAAALCDTRWIAETRGRLEADRRQLETALSQRDLACVGGTDLFVLARTPQAAALHTELAARHVLTRPFDHDASLLRFGVPAGDAHRARLCQALDDALANLT